jgi:anti-sigma factor RsiW
MKPLRLRDRLFSDSKPPIGTCKRTRQWLVTTLSRRLGPEAGWVRKHVAACPRCQKRLAALRKVETALSLLRSQPQSLDLLGRANTHAIKMLEHDLRDAPKARKLERSRPEPSLVERFGPYRHSAVNVAACITIVLLTRAGVFRSFDKARTGGDRAMRQYYAHHIGEDLARELFDA